MSYLPENYLASRETAAFQNALQPEADAIWEARDQLLAQLNPYTATWGLWYWEDALGLRACEGFPLDVRRRQVAAKLQGRAATTPKVVREVAETLLGTNVAVLEHFSECRVELLVEGGGQLPPGTAALKSRLREIMPAHLDWALVIPTLFRVSIRVTPGPRAGRSAPPRFQARLTPGHTHAAPLLGVRSSTATLPMAASI